MFNWIAVNDVQYIMLILTNEVNFSALKWQLFDTESNLFGKLANLRNMDIVSKAYSILEFVSKKDYYFVCVKS